jgi:protein phosphatase
MLEAFALSDVGRVRTNNEDYCLTLPQIGLYLLADGMGGAKAGETASRMAVDTVADIVEHAPSRDAQILLRAVEEANRRVLQAAASDPQLDGMGTTLVAVLEVGEGLAIASVGDSRAYLLDESGFRAVTEDQTWVHEVGRPLGLDEESLRNHPMRHVLTMAIGVSGTLSIRYYAIQLQPSALLLLSSDGLHGVVEPSRIEGILRERLTGNNCLERKCQSLIEAAKQAGAPDNVTCVLVRNPEITSRP